VKFVIAYDISNDKRRERVARVLLHFGERVQKSVFIAALDQDQQSELKRELGVLLRLGDRVEWFPIDQRNPDVQLSWLTDPNSELSVRTFE
jgi:CRISPR-associated protein Cas2